MTPRSLVPLALALVLLPVAAACGSSSPPAPSSSPPDPMVSDPAACAQVTPQDGLYQLTATTQVPSCTVDATVDNTFQGEFFAVRGPNIQFASTDDTCPATYAGCSVKADCTVYMKTANVAQVGHYTLVAVFRDAKDFDATIALSIPALACNAKVAVTGQWVL